jgi:predicted transcriptional regulator
MTTIRKTYETPETNTLQVHVLTYADLFDMVPRLAARRAEFVARIKQINSDAILERAEQVDLEWRTREPEDA